MFDLQYRPRVRARKVSKHIEPTPVAAGIWEEQTPLSSSGDGQTRQSSRPLLYLYVKSRALALSAYLL